MFVRSGDVLYNAQAVRSLRRTEGGTEIRYSDGTQVTVQADFDDVAFDLGPVVSDTSGTRSLHLELSEHGVDRFTRPIIGWRMTAFGPIAISPTGDEVEYLLYSDGTVDWVGFGHFPSVGDAVEDFEKRTRKP